MSVKDVVAKRFSTRDLDPSKKISDNDINTILEAGIKAPNGFGMEAWKFVVLSGNMEKVKEACFGQPWMGNVSHAIVLFGATEESIKANPSLLIEKFKANGFPDGFEEKVFGALNGNITQYNREQTYFAASQMILQATDLGLGSVAVGGYDGEAIAKLAKVDTNEYLPSLVIMLGYSNVEFKGRNNKAFDEVVTKIEL